MSTRDLGQHVVELHEQEGALAITGEGVRLTLTPQEALDLQHWLTGQQSLLQECARRHAEQAVPEILREETSHPDPTEREVPVDEP
ncbi:hypothetical protein [Dictyobacter arantiisoli]|uniref:Uncharacterized protein n=1 Tax=Dictyobacter arantiisoli TaxID=2014874 RepID=A0A5A5T8B5_9CHLR|nr:hypothetical protein [Dictyobacter arantiisoli]GCF07721.1 hypothetical protein KDI_12850 [Dictyobacter arantiisoli]